MQKTEKITSNLGVLILLMIFFVLVYILYSGWTDLRESGYLSCLASTASEIHNNKSKLPIEIKNDWTILSATETDDILSKIEPYDCGNTSNPLFDLWDNKIQIAARKTEDRTEIIVWSKGADGISYTDDDIVFPFGKTPPK